MTTASVSHEPRGRDSGRRLLRLSALLLLVTTGIQGVPARAADEDAGPARTALKVCADPYMLPFSNKDEKGYENRIAELFGKKLGLPVKYEWFPQRMGFIRNTLRAQGTDGGYKCDIVMNVPENFELAATTEPYYTSTYALVYARGRNLDSVTSPDMLVDAVAKNPDIKIGLPDRGPAQLWVFRHDLMGNMIPYQGQPGDPRVNPGELMMEDIAAGKIDAAIIWGPTAGYYAKQLHDQADLVLLPMHDDPKHPDAKFEFSFAMAVRYGDDAWRAQVQKLINDNQSEINNILKEYGVPLLPVKRAPRHDDDD